MVEDILVVALLVLILVVLIVSHELGHFLVAKRNGVKAEEFGIFFPPKIWGRVTKNGWLFSINAIPLGGFVRLKGEFDSDTTNHSYGAASLGAKAKILLAGVGMNFLVAFVLLTVIAWIGMPQLLNNQFQVKSDSHVVQHAKNSVLVGQVESNSPAAQAGIKSNDTLISIGPPGHVQNVNNADDLPNITKSYAGQKVIITYINNGTKHTATVVLRSNSVVAAHKGEGYLGIGVGQVPSGLTLVRSTWSAPIVAGGLMVQYTVDTFQVIGSVLHGVGSIIAGAITGNHAAREVGQTQANQLSGPVGIFKLLRAYVSLGYIFVLWIAAIISLSLGVVNVLPLPPLDGGKLFMTLIAHARRRRLTKEAEAIASAVGFIFFFVIFIFVTIGDFYKHF